MSSPSPNPSPAPTVAATAPRKRTLPRMAIAGWIVSTLVVLFTFIDGITKMAAADMAVDGSASLGFPAHYLFGIGLTLVICSLIYMVPFTSLIGAVLMTGYLGGATAIQIRVESTNFLFALFLGVMVWVGLLLRDRKLRALLRESLLG